MSKHHTVKLHKWVNGALQWSEHVFSSVHDAHAFIKKADCHTAKIVNAYGHVLHEEVKQPVTTNTYA